MITTEEFEDLIEASNEPLYKVGNMVCSKTTGLPGVGRVFALMPALSYCGLRGNFEMKRWDVFENWRQDYVYLVIFQESRKHITLEEYIAGFPEQDKDLYVEGALEKLYERQTNLVRTIAYPEQDLELFQ